MNRKSKIKLELTAIAKIMIMVTSIGHLIFTSIHVKALLLLENEICGFAMFLFVLFGLMAMFETTRIRDRVLEKIITSMICFLTAGFGFYLTSIYRYALLNQRALEAANVSRAAIFSSVIIGIYVIAGIILLIDLVKRPVKEWGIYEKREGAEEKEIVR